MPSPPSYNASSSYTLKMISFDTLTPLTPSNPQVPILLQNANGPCPLIGVANVLLLRRTLVLPEFVINKEFVSNGELVDLLGCWVIDNVPTSTPPPPSTSPSTLKRVDSTEQAYHIQQILTLLPTLAGGMDVNPIFTSGPFGLEYTASNFDTFGVRIVHGWLLPKEKEKDETIVDGGEREGGGGGGEEQKWNENEELTKLIGQKSYNELICATPQIPSVTDFLQLTCSQLTSEGIDQLKDTLQENSLHILFRNNHFNVILQRVEAVENEKDKETLLLLITDQTLSTSNKQITWESLEDVSGRLSEFYDSSFSKMKIISANTNTGLLQDERNYGGARGDGSSNGSSNEVDIALQMSLDELQVREMDGYKDDALYNESSNTSTAANDDDGGTYVDFKENEGLTDEEMAIKMDREENGEADEEMARQLELQDLRDLERREIECDRQRRSAASAAASAAAAATRSANAGVAAKKDNCVIL